MSSFLKPAPAVRPLRVPALHSANSQAKDKRAVEPTVFAGHFAPTGVRASDMCLPHNIYIYIYIFQWILYTICSRYSAILLQQRL